MTEAEIAERFIRAAETERKLPQVKGLRASYGSFSLPYVHSYADKAGWRKVPGDHLAKDDEPLKDERAAFWSGKTSRPSAEDISRLDLCSRWIADLLVDERQRRALWAWARSKAGSGSFKNWCEVVEGIHVETGRRRKDRAISRISCGVAGKPLQNNKLQGFGVLPEGGVAAYFEPTFEAAAQNEAGRPSWKMDPSLRPVFDADNQDFSWAQKRNERRRANAERDKAA